MTTRTKPSGRPPSRRAALHRMLLRLLVIGAIALGASTLWSLSMSLADRLPEAERAMMATGLIVAALLLYTLLIAVPFVPGIEIGLALLVLRGASIAPAIYLATVTGLMLAFLLGRLVPPRALARFLLDLRLRKAGRLALRNARRDPDARRTALESRLPRWLAPYLVRYRYLGLAALLNLPGNAVLGGGGGLMLMAGLSRLFTPATTLVTLLLAVLPIPLIVWLSGTGALPLLR